MIPPLTVEKITQITHLAIVEAYRAAKDWGTDGYDRARCVDRHLTDLSTEIIEALQEPPSEKTFNELRKEMGLPPLMAEEVAGLIEEIDPQPVINPDMDRTDEVLKKMLNTPPGEQNTPESQPTDQEQHIEPEPDKAAAETENQPDAPDGGSAPGSTKESNESPTTDQPEDKESEPDPARVDGGSGSAGSGADPDPNQGTEDDKWLTARVRTFKNDYRMSNMRTAKLAGCSDWAVCTITQGKHVSQGTRERVLAAIDNYKPKGEQKPKPGPKKHNGTGGRGAAEFVQAKLKAWLEAEDLDADSASVALRVSSHALRSILAGHLPHSNVVYELCKYIPEIKAQQSMLVSAADQQEAT